MPRPVEPVYVNPYQPSSLVELLCRVAILSRFTSQADFVRASKRFSYGWTESSLTAALPCLDRVQVEAIQTVVNATEHSRASPVLGLEPHQRWMLVAFFDSVVGPPNIDSQQDTKQIEGDLPGHYFVGLCNAGPARSKPEVLVRATAMRTFLLELHSASDLNEEVCGGVPPLSSLKGKTVRDAIEETVADLCIVAVQPPNMGGVEATTLMAQAGTIALAAIRQRIEIGAPGSWRLVRVITECLRHSAIWPKDLPDEHPRNPFSVLRECVHLLEYIDDNNPPNEYRARSLWEEAVGNLPLVVDDASLDQTIETFNERLLRRGLEGRTALSLHDRDLVESPLPVRERITAIWTYLWRVCRRAGWQPQELSSLAGFGPTLNPILELSEKLVLSDQEVDRGLKYAGEYLRAAVSDRVFWPWPERPEDLVARGERQPPLQRSRERSGVPLATQDWWWSSPEALIVRSALEATIERGSARPAPLIEPALRSLCYQACLTIDGVARRNCLVTLESSGLSRLAAEAFSQVTYLAQRKDSRKFRWLIENSTFALGWMSCPQVSVNRLLNLAEDVALDHSIRMTAFHALADMAEELRQCDHRNGTDWCGDVAAAATSVILDAPDANVRIEGIYQGKLLVRSALYVLAMLRLPDPQIIAVIEEIRDDVGQRFEEHTSQALAQWALRRISVRREVDDSWQRLQPQDQAGRWTSGSLRRLSDPLDALYDTLDQQ